jgi:hypothetical protein
MCFPIRFYFHLIIFTQSDMYHCDEWDRVVALLRHKFVTGATLLQLIIAPPRGESILFEHI